jgi:hypothetical protein
MSATCALVRRTRSAAFRGTDLSCEPALGRTIAPKSSITALEIGRDELTLDELAGLRDSF